MGYSNRANPNAGMTSGSPLSAADTRGGSDLIMITPIPPSLWRNTARLAHLLSPWSRHQQ